MQGSVTVRMAASPEVVWDLVSDVTRIGEFSPETFEAVWLDGATGPAAGARFKGHVKRNGVGPVYWTECHVVDCVPQEKFGFVVIFNGSESNRWTYELAPDGDGTLVTESYALAPGAVSRIYWALLGWHRSKVNSRGMQRTLESIRVVAEADQKGAHA